MDNRYIFAAVKDMTLEIKDFAGNVGPINLKVSLQEPEQYITQEELKALGDIVKKHINNLREDVEKEICTAMDENEWGERDFENRLDDELFQFNIPHRTISSVKQAENEAEVIKEMKEAGHVTEPSEPEVFIREDIDS